MSTRWMRNCPREKSHYLFYLQIERDEASSLSSIYQQPMTSQRSRTILTLLVSQMVSLLSLLLWFSLYSMFSKSPSALEEVGAIFQVYPVLPVALSALAWFLVYLRRYSAATILSLIPAVIAFLLMSYYFVVGLAHHSA